MRLLALSGVTAAAAVCTQCPLPQLNVTAFMPCLKQPIGEECCAVGRPMVNDPCVKVWLANPMLAPYKGIVEKAQAACNVSKMADCTPAVATACPTECGAPPPPANLMNMLSPAAPRPDTKMPVGGPGMMGPGMMAPPPAMVNMSMQLNMQMGPAGTSPMHPQGAGCTVCPLPAMNASAFAPCMAQTVGEECCAIVRPMVGNPCAKVWMNHPAMAAFHPVMMQAVTACNITQHPECNEAVAKICPKECGSEMMSACRARVANQTAECAGKIGCAISQCMPDGSFSPRQCHGSTGYCWCVDKDGKEVENSRTAPGKTAVNCATEPAKEKTPCQKRAQSDAIQCGRKIGCDQTKCNDDGSFMPKQCRGSTGYCWCVDKDGKEVDGSKKGPGQTGEMNCATASATTPSECNCPPVECAPGWVKKLKLGTEGCCKKNYQCVPSDAPNADAMRAGKAAGPKGNASEESQTRGSVSQGKPKNRGGKKAGKRTKAPTVSAPAPAP